MDEVHLLANIILPFLDPASLVSLLRSGVCLDVNANRPRFWLDYTQCWSCAQSEVWMELGRVLEGFRVADAVMDIMYLATMGGHCSVDEPDDPHSGFAKLSLVEYRGVQSGGCTKGTRTCYLTFEGFGKLDSAFKRRPHLASGLQLKTGIFSCGHNGTISSLLYMTKILGNFK